MDPAHRRVLDRFPPALRAWVLEELAAGNTILEVGAGHPAPPAGDMIKLALDMRTQLATGLVAYARNGSLHHTEVTDADRMFWVLTAPHAPPPEPDMNMIRAVHNTPPPPLPAPREYPPGSIEMDHRGEMLILHEADRRTEIVWTWNRGNQLYRSSLGPWWYPKDWRSQPMTDEEKEQVIARFMEFARTHIGTNVELRD